MFRSVPLQHQQELLDVPVLDAVAAHVELVQGDHILGEVVPDGVVDPEFSVDRLQGSQQVGDLDVELLVPLFADEVDLPILGLTDGDGVAPAQQFQIHDVLQDQVDVLYIAAVDGFPDAVVGDVVFLIGGEDLLALEILPFDLEQQEGIGAEPLVNHTNLSHLLICNYNIVIMKCNILVVHKLYNSIRSILA